MSAPDPSQFVSQFTSLKTRYESLANEIHFNAIVRDLTDTTEKVHLLPDEIARLRERGYIFAKYLEHKAEVLAQNWETASRQVQNLLPSEIAAADKAYQQASLLIQKGQVASSKPAALSGILPPLENALKQLENLVNAAASRLRGVYSTVATDIQQAASQIEKFHWYMDQKDEASFPFLAGESLFLAAKAEWVATGNSGKDPDGILYLTDQRLIFEQKETTGKKLGLFGGKKTQELEWEIPLNQIESVGAENKGLFGGKDMINLKLRSGARYPSITLEVKGGVQSKFWASQLQRMLDGKANDERAIQPDAETLEAIRKAPTACHVCGATLPRLVANQTQLECDYCGAVIRF